jgi:hypothetical protein
MIEQLKGVTGNHAHHALAGGFGGREGNALGEMGGERPGEPRPHTGSNHQRQEENLPNPCAAGPGKWGLLHSNSSRSPYSGKAHIEHGLKRIFDNRTAKSEQVSIPRLATLQGRNTSVAYQSFVPGAQGGRGSKVLSGLIRTEYIFVPRLMI